MPEYRCPVDDKIFSTDTKGAPTLAGHPDCDGPHCKKKFAVRKDQKPLAEDLADDQPPHP